MRSRYRIERRALLTGGAALTLAAVPGARIGRTQALDRFSFQTDWRAQAEHGGFYQAVASGLYRRAGLDVEIRMGGPQQNPAQLLVAGRVDAAMGSGFMGLNFVRENIPFLVVAAMFQKDPQILMTHEGNGITSFEAMRGRPILVGASGRVTYWPFLRARFGFQDEQIRPYTFNIQPWLADRNAIQQGFLSSEPFSAIQAGARPRVFLIADAGYDNYNCVVSVGRQLMETRGEVLQRFINASIEGWAQYMRGQDVEAANRLIMRDNPEMNQERIDYAIRVMNEMGIVASGDAQAMGIGAMTDARWERFYTTMRDAGAFPPGMDVRRAYDLRFVNRRVGLT
ncbi:MAG: ABC transporter substrate-binding protein [Acetobacteraceae bacterium]|nr:ABC transporter substrate-binding protein [Acetobacteraceae bacterium]